MHLNAEQLVDIAEGARPESAGPHLAACETCRAQLHDLRAMMLAASDVPVPEPSPLFWDHLSSRVREAVSVESAPRRAWLDVQTWRRVLMPIAAVAVVGLLLAVLVNSRLTGPAAAPAIADAAASIELLNGVAANDDAPLTLVASLTDEVDLDTAREAGLAPAGSAEHAVTHMSGEELRELGRLLKEELARSGA